MNKSTIFVCLTINKITLNNILGRQYIVEHPWLCQTLIDIDIVAEQLKLIIL